MSVNNNTNTKYSKNSAINSALSSVSLLPCLRRTKTVDPSITVPIGVCARISVVRIIWIV